MQGWTRAAGWASALVLAAGTTSGCGGGDGDGDGGSTTKDQPRGNGIAEMEPADALAAALEANEGLEDVVYSGRMGVFLGLVSHTFDTRIVATSEACSVELTSGADGAISVLLVDGDTYIKGDEQAMTEVFGMTPEQIDLVDGRWMVADQEPPPDLTEVCTLAPVVSTDMDASTCLPGGEEDVDGVATVGVRCRRGTSEQTIHVAASGDPLILRMEGQTHSGRYELTLEETDTGGTISAPPEDEVIDNRAIA